MCNYIYIYIYATSHLHKYSKVKTLYSLLCWITFGSNYRLESSWVWHSQALAGWMGRLTAQLFSGLSRDVRSGSSPGTGWAHLRTFRVLSRSHFWVYLVCVLMVVVLLEGEPSPQSKVSRVLDQESGVIYIPVCCLRDFSIIPSEAVSPPVLPPDRHYETTVAVNKGVDRARPPCNVQGALVGSVWERMNRANSTSH